MARFDKAIQTALKLIAKNGKPVKWRIIDDVIPSDPLKPWKPGEASPIDKDVVICFLPADKQTLETFTFIKGTEVPKGSVIGLMGGVPFEPNLKDVVIDNGKEKRIANIEILSPNGQTILHTVLFQS